MMIEKLFDVESNILELLKTKELKSMYIDYEPPTVERIWFQLDEFRVLLHKIHVCDSAPLFHPHPWKSAVRIIKGSYRMDVGHSHTDIAPPVDASIILSADSAYEMVEMDGWHSVRPLGVPSFSLMVTGERYPRSMPLEPNKSFRELTQAEMAANIKVFENYYQPRN